MKEFIYKSLGSIVRNLVIPLSTWLVAHQYFTQSQADEFVALLATGLVAAIWGVWEKHGAAKEKRAAKDSEPGASDAEVKVAAKQLSSPLTW